MKQIDDILSEVLGIDRSDIRDELTPDDIEEWDSFNALVLVSVFEDNYNIKFTTSEVMNVKCIGDIRRLLSEKGVKQ